MDLFEAYIEQLVLCDTLLGSCIPWRTIEILEANRRSLAFVRQVIVEAPEWTGGNVGIDPVSSLFGLVSVPWDGAMLDDADDDDEPMPPTLAIPVY